MVVSTLLSCFIQKTSKSNNKIVYKCLSQVSRVFVVLRPNSVLCIHQAITLPLGYIPSLNVQGFMQLNLVGFFLRHHFLVSSAGFCGCHHHRVSHWEWDYFLCTSQTTALLSGYTGVPVTGSPPLTPNFTGLSTLALIWHLVTVFRAHPYAPAGLALICWCSPTVLRLWELSHKHQLKD